VAELIIKTLSRKPKAALERARHRQRDRDCQGHRPSPVSAFGLQPHRTRSLKLSTDPLFVENLREVVGLYLNPPDKAVVLCVDEKSQIQALERTEPVLPKASRTITNPRDDHAVRCPQRV
jgi:putative transposase